MRALLLTLKSQLFLIASVVVFLATTPCLGQTSARTLEPCGDVQSIQGASCNDLSVSLDLSRCESSQTAVKIKARCSREGAVALYHSPQHTYRVVLEKAGSQGWQAKGRVWRSTSKTSAAQSPETAPIGQHQPAPIPLPIPGLPAVQAEDAKSEASEVDPGVKSKDITAKTNAEIAKPDTSSASELESKVEKQAEQTEVAEEEAHKATVAAKAEKLAPPPTPVIDEKTAKVLAALSDLTIRGSIDLYLSHNFNNPVPVTAIPAASQTPQNTYHIFDIYHESAQLSLARVLIQKQIEPVTMTLELGYGPSMQIISGSLTDNNQSNVMQAVIGYKTKGGILIEAGRFLTHMGYEVITAQDNWNYSRGVLFGYMVPFWHQGIKVTVPVLEKLSIMALVVNGWNNSHDLNDDKNYGAQVAYTPTETLAITFNYLTGKEPATASTTARGGDLKNAYELISTYKASQKLSFAVDANMLTYDTAVKSSSATGAALYARYAFAKNWAVSPRFEYLDDKDNLALAASFPSGQKLTTATVTFENKLSENLLWRAEYRSDLSTEKPFTKDGVSQSNQDSANLSVIGSF